MLYDDDYINKVIKIAEVRYELNEFVMEAFLDEIEICKNNGFTPIKTVEFIAEKIF